MSWITLNDTTLPVSEIIAIDMEMEDSEYIYKVRFRTLPPMRVYLYSTGGKWLYMICNKGIKEAQRGGLQYDEL